MLRKKTINECCEATFHSRGSLADYRSRSQPRRGRNGELCRFFGRRYKAILSPFIALARWRVRASPPIHVSTQRKRVFDAK
jgi:hypothetical protein